MKQRSLFATLILVFVVATTAFVPAPVAVLEGPGSSAAQASAELCAAIDVLEESVDALDDADSLSAYRAQFDVVRQDFQAVAELGRDQYPDVMADLEAAVLAFEAELDSFGSGSGGGDGGLLGGLTGGGGLVGGFVSLAVAAGDLAAAVDIADDAIDCPGAAIRGSADQDPMVNICAAIDALDRSVEVLDDLDPPADTWADYEAQFRVIEKDYEVLVEVGSEMYPAEIEAFGNAMAQFEESLLSLRGGGLISGILNLAFAAADLAAAEESLDDAIDCPGAIRGSAAQDSTEPAPAELCAALEVLDASLEVLDRMDPPADSLADYRAQFDVIQQDWQAVKEIGADLYPNAIAAFDRAMIEFERDLDSFGSGGLISGVLNLALAAGDLALAGEVLDEAIDCPGGIRGSAVQDATGPASPELCAAIDALDEEAEALDRMVPDTADYEAQYAVVQQAWQTVAEEGGEEYPNAFANYQQAADRFETRLAAVNEQWSISGLWRLALAAGELVIAEEALGFAVNCEGT